MWVPAGRSQGAGGGGRSKTRLNVRLRPFHSRFCPLFGYNYSDALRRIPVAVLTTSAAEADVVRTYDLGANCFLTKPVDVMQFVHVVQSIDDFWLGLVRLP